MNKLAKTYFPLFLTSVFFLTGCPGRGDRLIADETTTVSRQHENVCFYVPDAKNYRVSLIAINPRGIPSGQYKVRDLPDLHIINSELCITPEFYRFPDKGQFIVNYILEKPGEPNTIRSVATGIEFSGNNVTTFRLADNETVRKYGDSEERSR